MSIISSTSQYVSQFRVKNTGGFTPSPISLMRLGALKRVDDFFSYFHKPNFGGKLLKGFTLTELIVVLGLVALSSTIVLFNYKGSRQGATLSASALDVAGMVRIAQTGGRTGSQDALDYNYTGEITSANDTSRTGVNFRVVSNVIDKITVYRGKNFVSGFQPGIDIPLEVKTLTSSGIKARICSDTGTFNFAQNSPCTIVPGGAFIEFSRLSSTPIIDSTLGATNSNPVIIQLESAQGGTVLYRYVVIEATGNIFVR